MQKLILIQRDISILDRVLKDRLAKCELGMSDLQEVYLDEGWEIVSITDSMTRDKDDDRACWVVIKKDLSSNDPLEFDFPTDSVDKPD